MPEFSTHHYKSSTIPSGLTFDEESLFWRLRLGEGIPTRKWHKPLDRSKTWHEIKAGLDRKIEATRTTSIFRKIFPCEKGFFARFFARISTVIKQSFLLEG
jgi:hypothetical protein